MAEIRIPDAQLKFCPICGGKLETFIEQSAPKNYTSDWCVYEINGIRCAASSCGKLLVSVGRTLKKADTRLIVMPTETA